MRAGGWVVLAAFVCDVAYRRMARDWLRRRVLDGRGTMPRCPSYEKLCDMAEVRGLAVRLTTGPSKKGPRLNEIQLWGERGVFPAWREAIVRDAVDAAARRLLARLK